MELSKLIAERSGLVDKASKTSELLWEKPFQDQDLVVAPNYLQSYVKMPVSV